MFDGNITFKKIVVKFLTLIVHIVKAHTDIQKLLKKEDVKVIYKNFLYYLIRFFS